jgi:hypothetical protein
LPLLTMETEEAVLAQNPDALPAVFEQRAQVLF